ncbi:gluconokinase [Acidovorax sp.]|uniref:gluconokinase n=1 Tax=Acidovorax sp. TaxID=1872122 RepID=UPI00391FBBE5
MLLKAEQDNVQRARNRFIFSLQIALSKMKSIVMMGVAGCGKSSAGLALANALGLPLIEGDAYHPQSNIDKIRQGVPLTDEDRTGWLDALGGELARHSDGAVLTCSALRRSYRDRLREASMGLRFVFLDISHEQALERVTARAGEHMFPPVLVASQFATLESPIDEAGVLHINATLPVDQITQLACAWLRSETQQEEL